MSFADDPVEDPGSDEAAMDEPEVLPPEESGDGVPVGYVVTWTTPDGRRRSKWYKRCGHARNRIERLGETGAGLNPRLFRTSELTEMPEIAEEVYDSSLAEKKRDWASTPWKRRLLQEEPPLADWVRTHPRADRLLEGAEGRLTKAGRRARRN